MSGYRQSITIEAPADQVYAALTTADGMRGWWTSLVNGQPASGDVHLGFVGLDEHITMHVEAAVPAERVEWTCHRHTGHPEWVGTRIIFELEPATPAQTTLRLHHVGLVPTLSCFEACDAGWRHFLTSIAGHCEHGRGQPFDDRPSTR